MSSVSAVITASSSTLLRLAAIVFLRWIPGHHFPPVIFTLGAIYFFSFAVGFLATSPFDIIVEEIDIITKETINQYDDDEAATSTEHVGTCDEPAQQSLVDRDVDDIVFEVKKQPARLRSLLWGLPSPTSLLWSLLTVAINLSLLAMTADMVYRGPVLFPVHDLSFARVGYVSYDSATLLVREPRTLQKPISLSYRYADPPLAGAGIFWRPDTAWKHAGWITYPAHLNNDTDYTASIQISGLRSDTRYQYAFSNNHSGHFITAPRPGQFSKRHGGKFSFATSSCIIPRFPYNPIDHPLHIQGFTHLARWIPALGTQFMLFLGDFIYVDVPHRFGKDAETYRSEYRRVYGSPDWQSVTKDLPWIHVWDDHEIANDWDKNTTGVWSAAFDPWNSYQAAVNPNPTRKGATWFTFTQGPASFFLPDTRTYRTTENENATDVHKSMLGRDQLADLLHWLRRPPPRGVKWKIMASSIPFTKNWRFGDRDTWGKYLVEREAILQEMWEAGAKQGVGVVVLSGDRHEFAATSFPPPMNSKWPVTATVHEFSASPLNMFYLPFRTYKQEDNEDICIKYLPDGNSKFGVVEIEKPPHSANSLLKYRLVIDGDEVWSYVLTSPPAPQSGFFDGIWS